MGIFSQESKKGKIKQGIYLENLKQIKEGMSVNELKQLLGEPDFTMPASEAFAMFDVVPAWANDKENWLYNTEYGHLGFIILDKSVVHDIQFLDCIIEKMEEAECKQYRQQNTGISV